MSEAQNMSVFSSALRWCVANKFISVTVISFLFMIVSEYIRFSHISAIENQQAQIQQAQIRLQQENIELRQAGTHAAETMFALKLSGTKQTATITENAMLGYYQKNLRYLEHCKKAGTCQLPNDLAVVEPLPNYVPIAAIYLQDPPRNDEKSH